jgi:hypothetical protein
MREDLNKIIHSVKNIVVEDMEDNLLCYIILECEYFIQVVI